MKKLLCLTILLLLLISIVTRAQDDCVLKKSDNSILVYLCEDDSKEFKTIIVELEVPATLAQYAALVLDVDNYINWQYKVSNQKVLESLSATELYYYSVVSTPWPVSNRDNIFHLTLTQNPETLALTVTLKAIPDYLPEKDGIVRLPFAESILTVEPISRYNVRVKYTLDVDPGGEIPAWVINLFAPNAPWHSYNNFRTKILEQGENRIEAPFINNFLK